MSEHRIYVRDDRGRFAETGALNKKLKGVARELSTLPGTKLSQRVTFRRHGITSERQQQKVVNMVKAGMRSRARSLTSEKPVKISSGKKSIKRKR